jgi:hypothetical protein
MLVDIVPLMACDVADIELQASQAHMRPWMTVEFAHGLETAGGGYTALHNGRPVAMAGVCDLDGYRYAWAFLGQMARPVMLAATRACLEMLTRETDEVRTHVRRDLPANVRWLKMLGFKPTGQIDDMPDGFPCELWVRRNDH